jgi:3',5'-nucleoside bisphosphate phosphatase
LRTYRAELHVHTVLSPCAQVEMIPPLIIRSALESQINLIAITDHNHTANIAAVQKAAAGSGLVVLPGMEIQTREEVHVLCLFDTLEQAQLLQAFVDQKLPGTLNNADFFGEQFIVDETGDFISNEDRLLINSVNASFEQVYEQVANIGGLFIPAHVNRKTFGLLANLGLVPTGVDVEALEISRHIKAEEACQRYPQIQGYPLIQSGDVHGLDEFLGSTQFIVQAPSIAEFRLALRNEQGRSCQILSLPPS